MARQRLTRRLPRVRRHQHPRDQLEKLGREEQRTELREVMEPRGAHFDGRHHRRGGARRRRRWRAPRRCALPRPQRRAGWRHHARLGLGVRCGGELPHRVEPLANLLGLFGREEGVRRVNLRPAALAEPIPAAVTGWCTPANLLEQRLEARVLSPRGVELLDELRVREGAECELMDERHTKRVLAGAAPPLERLEHQPEHLFHLNLLIG